MKEQIILRSLKILINLHSSHFVIVQWVDELEVT